MRAAEGEESDEVVLVETAAAAVEDAASTPRVLSE
jgi:hypothetical protein